MYGYMVESCKIEANCPQSSERRRSLYHLTTLKVGKAGKIEVNESFIVYEPRIFSPHLNYSISHLVYIPKHLQCSHLLLSTPL